MKSIRTLIADDHPIFLKGLISLLQQPAFQYIKVVGTAADGTEALEKALALSPDLLILDMNMPKLDGSVVIKELKKQQAPCDILIMSMYDQPKVIRTAFKAGADAYLLKDKAPEELEVAINAILDDETYFGEGVHLNDSRRHAKKRAPKYQNSDRFVNRHLLTKREMEILQLIAEALSNKEIGKRLYISDQTVGVHRKNIMRKLGVTNTAGLLKIAHDQALI